MLNRILDTVGKGIGILAEKLQPLKNKLQPFWDWVDKKWYRADRKY